MCNAHNHSPSCTCGFGGEGSVGGGYGGSRTIYWFGACGAAVYFYRSPFDGRVFFDDLGPPWPKHACTDNGLRVSAHDEREEPGSRLLLSIGSTEGWRSFVADSVVKIANGQLRLTGRMYARSGQIALEGLFETQEPEPSRLQSLLHFHQHGSGLPFLVRQCEMPGDFEITEIGFVAKGGEGSGSDRPIPCTTLPGWLDDVSKSFL